MLSDYLTGVPRAAQRQGREAHARWRQAERAARMATRLTAAQEYSAALKALLALSREVVADSRNHRHLAVIRRALLKRRMAAKK